ncbi:MAG TPA: heme biosynthesis HemY N-terminal domain-containing protein [Acidiferrobacter sp.]|nr:heme biosynthesis HemY N-terminal domain-containing protein [Acidiferrobacter sp.]
MKTLAAIVILLFVTVFVTLGTIHNPGYVLIEHKPWSVEMPLALFALLLLATVALLYFLLHVILRVLHIPRDVGRWRLNRRVRHLQKALHTGVIKLLEGDYAGAEKDFTTDLKAGDLPGVHYLGAACAAQGQHQYERRDEYLTHAQVAPRLTLATGLLQAHLYETAREHERSLATLSALRIANPGNRTVLRLLAQRAQGLHDWSLVAQLAPELRRYRALEPAAIDAIELTAHRHLLMLATTTPGDYEDTVWRAIPKGQRQQPTLIAIYARSLIQRDAMDEAERLLTPALRQEPTDELFAAYGELRGPESLRFLSQAETWLKSAPGNPVLLLCLAKLALAANLPGKAREYAERCVRQSPGSETYAELALVMERLGDETRAREYCRRGLNLQKNRPDNRRTDATSLPF